MKRTAALILLLLPFALSAQQIGMYSHYFYKPMVYNPAFTGLGDVTNVMVVTRAQWTDFKGAPQLNIATLDGSFMEKKAGLGMTVISDRKGISSRIGGDLSYSYKLKLNEETRLLFGVSLGIVDQMIDYSKAQVETASDPVIFGDSQRKTVFNGNAGIGLTWKELEFGFAVPQILGNRINYVDTSNVRAYYTQARHFMGSLKYRFYLSREKGISLSPLALVRFVPNAPVQYDGNINLDWRDKFWIGATYKSGYAVAANAGFCIHKQLYVGYSYDFIIGSIGKYSGVSHELMMNFKFGKNRKEEQVEAPVETKSMLNSAYEQRMDSLQNELKLSQERLDALNDRLNAQEKKQQELQKNQQQNQSQNQNQNQNQGTDQGQQPANSETGNQNAQIEQNSANKRYENGAMIVSAPAAQFKDLNSQTPPKGYFVVIGTFYYRDLAVAEAQRFVARGYKTTDWVYSGPKNYNYIFMFKCKTKEEAMEKLKVARDAGVKDAWIQELTD